MKLDQMGPSYIITNRALTANKDQGSLVFQQGTLGFYQREKKTILEETGIRISLVEKDFGHGT